MSAYYGLRHDARPAYVAKSLHRPPGLSRDFRGWAVMIDGVEVSLHRRCTDAYTYLARTRRDR